jgi:hypothetical protein
MKWFKGEHAGIAVAGVGVVLWAIDSATTPTGTGAPGTYAGKVYGAGAPLNTLTTFGFDPTLAFLILGGGIWAWMKFKK